MRVDRLLHRLRLTKSRTQAQALILKGHIRCDGRRLVKPSDEVRQGAILTLPLHGQLLVLRIDKLPVRRGPAAEASAHYVRLDVDGSEMAQ